MRVVISICLIAQVASASSSLLEMSQTLWTKALEGGLTKIGGLDPLRIPVVKVDQSEGNTSYRMILHDVKIRGLNSSSLESIHIGRGTIKANLSEHEAGYVSYTDQRELDTIRYRFHMVVKEPKGEASENLEVRSIPEFVKSTRSHNLHGRTRDSDAASDNNGNYGMSPGYQDNRGKTIPPGHRRIHEESTTYRTDRREPQVHRSNYEISDKRQDEMRHYASSQNLWVPQQSEYSNSYTTGRSNGDRANIRNPVEVKNIPGRVRIVYAERQMNPGDNYRTTNQRAASSERSAVFGSNENCDSRKNSHNEPTNFRQRDNGNHRQTEEIGTAASMNFENRRAYADARLNPGQNAEVSGSGKIRNNESKNENRYSAAFNAKIEPKNDDQRKYSQYGDGSSSSSSSSQRLENRPGYVDIVYTGEKDQKIRHFGNLRVEPGRDTTVYSLEDVLRDLRDHKTIIIHNFTEGEDLMKKNDAVRTASETRRIKDLARYAKDFQEKQGYYEQGMQLIYHFGDEREDDYKGNGGRRTKRAHLDEQTEDDVMHVIMKIRVPMLRFDAGYVLTGKVGKQVLRGNGLLAANFTELIGDFTLELKKVDDDTMIVRAARARLSSRDRKITLQGMDEEGPVNEILTQGLMAAEAVAAMLADDLTTKALSEKTADSIIYRMYKNLPSEN